MISKIIKLKNKLLQGKTKTYLLKTFFVYGFIALSMALIKVLIARFYGQVELGIFTFFMSLASFVYLFTSFGFSESLTQTIVKDKSKLKDSLKFSIKLTIPFTILFIFLTWTIIKLLNFNLGIENFFSALIIYIITYTIYYYTYSIYRGNKDFVLGSIFSLVNRILLILSIIIAFILKIQFKYILYALSATLIITTIISLPKLKKIIKESNLKPTKTNQKLFFKIAFSLFLTQVGFYSLRYIDAIAIQYLVDFASLGLYSAYGSIINIIRLIAYVFPVVVLPMAAVSNYKIKKSLFSILAIIIPFAIFVLAASYIIVPLLYGANYKDLYLPIALVISSTLLVIYSYFNSIFVGENEPNKKYIKIISIDFFLSLILNTILNIYFIKTYGIIGAPIATSIVIVLKILLNMYAIKKMRRE
jgi:O-antigen/teichoic acid export membrane protein